MRNELVARILNETPVEVRVQVQMDAEQMVKEFESANMPDCRCYRKLEKCKDYMDCLQMNTKTFNMNLIQQLQATPKWGEFEDWYNQYLVDIHSYLVGNLVHLEDIEEDNQKDVYFGSPYGVNFCFLPIEFQKGVFEKFIESRGYNIEKQLHDISYQKRSEMSDEEILSKRFNECWFIRTVFLVGVYYQTHTLNPNDYTENSVPFDSFEELLIWYFNN